MVVGVANITCPSLIHTSPVLMSVPDFLGQLVPHVARSNRHSSTSDMSRSQRTSDFGWESHLVNTLLVCFSSTSVPTFLSRLREFSRPASDGEWMQRATLFMAMESGQRRLADRLANALGEVDVDDPESLIEGLAEMCKIICQIQN